ncbi:MAG: hypothetical protein WAN11_21290 [Syntrophobacteraceae bacterium]
MEISKEKYGEVIEEIRAMLKTDECSECSCPNIRCEWHGDCHSCVRIYRHFGDHVPRCLQFVIDKKAASMKESIETQMRKKPIPPDEYRDYLMEVAPKEGINRQP